MDETTWLALTAVLTVIGAVLTVLAWKRRGTAPALRAAGVTLLFPALYLTDTLQLVVSIGSSIGSWATRLVFSPVVWTGVGLGAVGVLLFLVGGSMMSRGRGVEAHRSSSAVTGSTSPAVRAPAQRQERDQQRKQEKQTGSSTDEGMDDIEAILRKRGIE